jgi:hypothetical protein
MSLRHCINITGKQKSAGLKAAYSQIGTSGS